MDLEDEIFGLEEADIIRRNKERALLLCDQKSRKKNLMQRSKLRWMRDGDVNSRTFHRFVQGRRKTNEIGGLYIRGVWNKDPNAVKRHVKETFESHFAEVQRIRPKMKKEALRMFISDADNSLLIIPFTEEEVWDAIDKPRFSHVSVHELVCISLT